jgi:hypothetical protein
VSPVDVPELFDLVCAGISVRRAEVLSGVSRTTGALWWRQDAPRWDYAVGWSVEIECGSAPAVEGVLDVFEVCFGVTPVEVAMHGRNRADGYSSGTHARF